jgi:hypothetical protein
MAYSNTSEAIEALAAEIGERVYIDVAKWHLYLRDAHLHTILAEKLYPMLTERQIDERQVMDAMKSIPVRLGGGKKEVALLDLVPTAGQADLMDLLGDYQDQL